jgi:hypothetical protein
MWRLSIPILFTSITFYCAVTGGKISENGKEDLLEIIKIIRNLF